MPSATASGSDAKPNGDAKFNSHNQGRQDRAFTVEQKTAVLRVRKCSATAFYDILGLEESKKSATDSEIKKAYRKLSLLTHPDKNGYEGADEAFKLVSRAFQVLSDPEKKTKYDRFGGDPDNRFGSGSAAASASPFGGFGRTPGSSRQGPMWEDEISPEEMFNRFFNGGMGGGFGPFGGGNMFTSGPQFVFDLGGGPGVRIHQFGGGRPRRRPREANDPEAPPPSLRSTLSNLLPLLLLFILPLLSSLFSSESASAGPSLRFDSPSPPQTHHRMTSNLKINYYVDPKEIVEWNNRKLNQLDQRAEVSYVGKLRGECEIEMDRRQRKIYEAQGWFFQDVDRMREARTMEMRSCRRLDELRVARTSY
ncbi:MAG: ATP-dependent RNA helicase mtr4 [Chaenotheca gracillima]|nr:MAG: ATP-dependent RNA helicase mtr4 [Chaenotheca gracillima]